MAKKIIKPFMEQGHYTNFHNIVLDVVMPRVSANAFKVLCCIIRRTRGYHKRFDAIGYDELKEGTGIRSNTTISAALKELLDDDLFGSPVIKKRQATRRGGVHRKPTQYQLNDDFQVSEDGDLGGSGSGSSCPENGHVTCSKNGDVTCPEIEHAACPENGHLIKKEKKVVVGSSLRVTGVSQNARVTATKTTPTTAPGLTPVAWPCDLEPDNPDWLAFVNITRPFADAPPDIQAEMLRSFDWMRQVAIPVPFIPQNAEIYLKRFVAKNKRYPHPDEVCRTWAKLMADLASEDAAPAIEIPADYPRDYRDEVSDLAKQSPSHYRDFLAMWDRLDDEQKADATISVQQDGATPYQLLRRFQ